MRYTAYGRVFVLRTSYYPTPRESGGNMRNRNGGNGGCGIKIKRTPRTVLSFLVNGFVKKPCAKRRDVEFLKNTELSPKQKTRFEEWLRKEEGGRQ